MLLSGRQKLNLDSVLGAYREDENRGMPRTTNLYCQRGQTCITETGEDMAGPSHSLTLLIKTYNIHLNEYSQNRVEDPVM